MNEVADFSRLIAWASSLGVAYSDETEEEFRQRFAYYMLTEHHDPVIAHEITLAKPIQDWTVWDRAEFLLDYKTFYENSEWRDRTWSLYTWCLITAGHKVAAVKHRRTRLGGAVASNPAELLTLEGTPAVNKFAVWDGQDPQWEGPRLKNPPRGFEEALRKRAACPAEGSGHLVVRHYGKDGKSTTKFIQPKESPQSVVSEDKRLGQPCKEEEHECLTLTKEDQEKAETPK